MKEFECYVVEIGETQVKLGSYWYEISEGLMKQVKKYFPVGTYVKVSVQGEKIKSLVLQEEIRQ